MKNTIFTFVGMFICLGAVAEQWGLVSDFDSPGSVSVVLIKQHGGNAGIVKTNKVENVLQLDLSAESSKRAVAKMDGCFRVKPDGDFKLAFDMKMEQGDAGYICGLRFGKPGSFIQAGRYAGSNGNAKYKGALVLDDKTQGCKLPLNLWLHYELAYNNGAVVLKVWKANHAWADSPEKYQKIPAEYVLHAKLPMAASDNELVLFNQDPYRVDEYPQNRGIISYDNIYQIGLSAGTLQGKPRKVQSFSADGCRFDIDLTNGMIAQTSRENISMVDFCCDEYVLKLRHATVITDELEDKVISHKTVGGRLHLECENSRLPNTKIIKEYYLQGSELCRRITFKPLKNIDGFLYVRTALNVNPEYRKNSYYSTFRDWSLPTFLPAEDIKLATGMGFMGADVSTQMNCMIRPDINMGLAQYQTHLDGRAVWPHYMVIGENMVYSTNGWEYPSMCFNPRSGVERSGEYRLRLFRGDQFNQHAHLNNLDYIKKMRDNPIPRWVSNIKLEAICWGDTPAQFAENLQKILNLSGYGKNEYAVMTLWGWAAWGYFPTKPDEKITIRSINEIRQQQPTQYLADQSATIHRKYPGVRYGNYHFLQALAKHHFYGASHPEWFAYGADGKPLDKPEPGWTPVHRLLKAPGAIDEILGGFDREQKRYDINMFYIDGGSRMKMLADWKTMSADQPYEYLDWWKKLHELAYKNNAAVFFNNNLNPFADMAYLESDHIRKYIDSDWRVIANSLLIAKYYQRPGQTLAILYRKARGDSDPEYTNLVLSLGLTPAGAGDLHVVPNWPELFGYIPYINAAYELKTSRLVLDCVVSPKFWTDVNRRTSLQVQALFIGSTLLVSAVNHTRDIVKTPIELDMRYSPVERDKPLYIWSQKLFNADYRTLDPQKLDAKKYVIPHVVQIQPVEAAKMLKTSKLTLQAEVPEKTLIYYVISNSPAVVTAINGRDTQFQLPETLGIAARVIEHQVNCIVVEVENPYDSVKLKVLLPSAWAKQEVTLNARKVEKEASVRSRPWQFINTEVKKGKSRLILKVR